MAAITRAMLVDAARDLNRGIVGGLSPEIDVTQGVEKLKELIKEAGTILDDADDVSDETRAVVAALSGKGDAEAEEAEAEAEEAGEVRTAPKPKDKAVAKAKAKAKVTAPPKAKVTAPPKAKVKEAATMPKTPGRKPPPLGRFVPVRRGSAYAKVLEAALVGSIPVDDACVAAQLDDGDRLTTVLKRARITNGIDYRIDDDGLTVVLPKGVSAENVWHRPKERKAAAPSPRATKGEPRGKDPVAAGDFKPIRAGTIREELISHMDGTLTAAQIAEKIGKTPANTSSHIFCLWRDCGIGFRYDAEGRVKVVPPAGKKVSDLVRAA